MKKTNYIKPQFYIVKIGNRCVLLAGSDTPESLIIDVRNSPEYSSEDGQVLSKRKSAKIWDEEE